jgi:hypothetical protein
MSWDLGILSATDRLEPDAAATIYDQLVSGADWRALLRPDERISFFIDEIRARWPALEDQDEAELEGPWSEQFDISPAHAILVIGLTWADEVAPFVVETALRHGLNVFDPQDDQLYSPGQKPRKARRKRQALRCTRCGKKIRGPHIEESDGIYHVGCSTLFGAAR